MALEPHVSFPQPSDPYEPAWRYMDLSKFAALLLRKELHFTRLDCLEDKFEGTLPLRFKPMLLEQMMRPATVENARPSLEKFFRVMALLTEKSIEVASDSATEHSERSKDERTVITAALLIYTMSKMFDFEFAAAASDDRALKIALDEVREKIAPALSTLNQLAEKIDNRLIQTLRDIEYNQKRMSTDELERCAQKFVDFAVSQSASFRKRLYVCCWHLGYWESEAMWRIYCGHTDGLAIVMPYERLCDSLTRQNTHIGKMTYISYDTEIFDGVNWFSRALHKRKEFSHEEEARIVSLELTTSEDMLPESLDIPWEMDNAIDEIIISPYAKPWYAEMVKELVERIAPRLASRVKMSSMVTPPTD